MKFKTKEHKSKYPYQPAIGVKTDFETLLQKFSSAVTVRYETFAECWRELNMATYCAGRQMKREAREFVEHCFSIAVKFWLPPSSFLVRAGALYLLYGLYNFQLVVPKVKIRITPDQWKQVEEFQQEARDQQHLDLDYVFQKMKLDKAFIFVATPDEVYSRRPPADTGGIIPENLKEETSMVDEVFNSSALNQIALVHSQYQKMKQVLTEEDDSSLKIINSDLLSNVYSTLKTHREKQAQASMRSQAYRNKTLEDMAKEMEPNSSTDDSVSVQKMLKQKAFEFTSPTSKKKGKKVATKPSSEEDTTTEDLQYDLQADSGKPAPKKSSRADLFEKDESENLPVELPQVHEVYQMPDLDSILPKPPQVQGNAKEGSLEDASKEKTTSKKGVKGKRKLSEAKDRKYTDKKPKTESEESSETEELEKSKKSDNSKAGRKPEKTSNKRQTSKETEKDSPKSSVREDLADVDSQDHVTGTDDLSDDQEDTNIIKKPSAQEILQMKLNKRKKEARMGAKNKNRKKAKK